MRARLNQGWRAILLRRWLDYGDGTLRSVYIGWACRWHNPDTSRGAL